MLPCICLVWMMERRSWSKNHRATFNVVGFDLETRHLSFGIKADDVEVSLSENTYASEGIKYHLPKRFSCNLLRCLSFLRELILTHVLWTMTDSSPSDLWDKWSDYMPCWGCMQISSDIVHIKKRANTSPRSLILCGCGKRDWRWALFKWPMESGIWLGPFAEDATPASSG